MQICPFSERSFKFRSEHVKHKTAQTVIKRSCSLYTDWVEITCFASHSSLKSIYSRCSKQLTLKFKVLEKRLFARFLTVLQLYLNRDETVFHKKSVDSGKFLPSSIFLQQFESKAIAIKINAGKRHNDIIYVNDINVYTFVSTSKCHKTLPFRSPSSCV